MADNKKLEDCWCYGWREKPKQKVIDGMTKPSKFDFIHDKHQDWCKYTHASKDLDTRTRSYYTSSRLRTYGGESCIICGDRAAYQYQTARPFNRCWTHKVVDFMPGLEKTLFTRY